MLPPAELAYVRAVEDGTLARGPFVESQVQFFFAVEAYPRSLASLAERLSPAPRRALEANVLDELGAGDAGQAHVRTFRLLLERLGVSAAETDARPKWDCTVAFNDGVKRACTVLPPEHGLAAIAAIEDLFSGISRDLGAAIVKRGWLSPDQLVHYTVHEQLDRAHADALYRQLDAASAEVAAGLDLGVRLLTGFYDGLLRGQFR